MANGDGASSDDFVMRSGVRSGLKRELAFALRSQSLLSPSLGRTRSGKPLGSPAAGVSPKNGSPLVSVSPVKFRGGLHLGSDSTVGDGIVVPLDGDRDCKRLKNDLPLVLTSSVEIQDDLVLKSDTRVGDGALVPISEDAVVPVREEELVAAAMESENGVRVEDDVMVDAKDLKKGADKGNLSTLGCDGSDSSDLGKPAKTFVKWYSRNKGLSKASASNASVSNGSKSVAEVETPILVDDGNGASEAKDELRGNRCANDKLVAIEDKVEHSNFPLKDVIDEPADVNSLSSIVLEEEKHLHPVVGTQVYPGLENSPIEKPMKRFTRSSLNPLPDIDDKGSTGNSRVVANAHEISGNDDDTSKPTRRFTRSALKSNASDSGVRDGASTSCESNESEEVKAYETVTSDLKMSKKITLKKIPGNARELLSTGLLEGLPVKYITNTMQSGLEGVIKGSGILCSCSSCNGCTVVSANVFELHAGSTKKHPSDFIFLKNGNNLRDVIKACGRSSLDMLEITIRDAVGGAHSKKNFTCQKCKESFLTVRTGKFALFCDSCLESKQSLKCPSSIPSDCGTYTPRTKVESISDWPDNQTLSSNKKSSAGRLTRKDLGLHKLVFMSGILPEGTEVGYYVRGERLLEGYIKDSGIFCRCCNTVVSPSQFESHAGQAPRRKPYNYIYTSNGVSLHELSVSLSKDRKLSSSENDDLCTICANYGDLLLCDLCPRAFHTECLGLSSIPTGKWQCSHCVNLQKSGRSAASNDNAIAAGRVEGVDPIEQIYKRCIRIVSITDTDESSCVLCKCHEFSKSGFSDNTVMICDQCGKEYHVKCLRDHKMADLKELPEGEWFCSTGCNNVWKFLLETLVHGPKPIPDVDGELIKRKCEGREGLSINISDLSWRLLTGSTDSEDSNLLLSSAVKIIGESFTPIVDRSGRDLIPFMVYGQMARDQDYGGTYCAVLTYGSSVVSAGTLRVMGSEVAELPLVATSREYQGLGLFQALFSCIERLLASMKVKHLVLPAAEEAKSIWTNKFGFTKLTANKLEEYLNGARPTLFHGTSVLYKPVSWVL